MVSMKVWIIKVLLLMSSIRDSKQLGKLSLEYINVKPGTIHHSQTYVLYFYWFLLKGYHKIDCLYICEYCLSFYVHKTELIRHN